MDATEFRETVEASKRTELDRLGSSQLLVALTDAELDAKSVLGVAAGSEAAAYGTFSSWADDEDHETAREVFETVADQEAEHYERVVAAMESGPDENVEAANAADPGPMHGYLRGRDDTVSRVAGGMVARSLVSLRTHTQIIGFFVNQADEKRANLFRELKSETQETLGRGLELLDELCDSEEEWERAQSTAEYVIQLAYDDYADALGELGLNPKSVC
ncbi:rubrerythrin family protein [Haloprofundus marisrubri]|uniref:Rubrerythrin family protein n=1 Tax=Haloprofundus marisrubri TaxID=1514971 RepID=A0A0W1RC78_9EURY|nr:rubrerythrin family protein [Haloprofundus marisrubri]KTG10227.1 rubrerythrin family protein [Haloprofundus marisrubri]